MNNTNINTRSELARHLDTMRNKVLLKKAVIYRGMYARIKDRETFVVEYVEHKKYGIRTMIVTYSKGKMLRCCRVEKNTFDVYTKMVTKAEYVELMTF